jgi:hypothetical protein
MHEQRERVEGRGVYHHRQGRCRNRLPCRRSAQGQRREARSALGQRRSMEWRRRRRFPSLLRFPVDRLGIVGGVSGWRRTSYLEPVAPPLYIAQCDRGPPTNLGLGAPDQGARLRGPVGRWAHWWDHSNRKLTVHIKPRHITKKVTCTPQQKIWFPCHRSCINNGSNDTTCTINYQINRIFETF